MSETTEGRARPTRGVEIPGVLVVFLDRANVAVAATRDAQLVPRVRWVCGWRAEPGHQVLRCVIQARMQAGLEESLRDNGQFAVTIEEIGPHETYQFKGEAIEVVPVDAEDLKAVEFNRSKFLRVIQSHFGFPEETCRAFFGEPGMTVRLRVREIFLQTPGPRAGTRLVPAEERR